MDKSGKYRTAFGLYAPRQRVGIVKVGTNCLRLRHSKNDSFQSSRSLNMTRAILQMNTIDSFLSCSIASVNDEVCPSCV